MITRAENYTKEKWTERTLGQIVKANLYRQNHTKKNTDTHSEKEKKNIKRKKAIKSINKPTNDNKL